MNYTATQKTQKPTTESVKPAGERVWVTVGPEGRRDVTAMTAEGAALAHGGKCRVIGYMNTRGGMTAIEAVSS